MLIDYPGSPSPPHDPQPTKVGDILGLIPLLGILLEVSAGFLAVLSSAVPARAIAFLLAIGLLGGGILHGSLRDTSTKLQLGCMLVFVSLGALIGWHFI